MDRHTTDGQTASRGDTTLCCHNRVMGYKKQSTLILSASSECVFELPVAVNFNGACLVSQKGQRSGSWASFVPTQSLFE